MFDFALTPRGDILFVQNEDRSVPLKLSFGVTNGHMMKIVFDVADCIPLELKDRGIKISFEVGESLHDKKALTLSGLDAKRQLIRLRLQTSLGDLSERPDFGSVLDRAKHLPLHSRSTQAKITEYAKSALKDMVSGLDVRVEPSVERTAGYRQGANIYIYENGQLILKYVLKE